MFARIHFTKRIFAKILQNSLDMSERYDTKFCAIRLIMSLTG